MPRLILGAFAAASLGLLISGSAHAAKPFPSPSAPAPVSYRSVKVDGLDIFYREAGAANAPTLLLLHGFPSSSRMFEPLLARLSGQFHLLAPDYPGFRQSLTSLAGAQRRHLGASPNATNYDPDLWSDEFAFLNKSGESDIQIDLFFDYRTNVASYSAWQAWLRQAKPPTLVVWGRYDQSFEAAEAQAYKREIPDADVHLIDAGHFALDEKPDEVAALIGAFMSKLSKSRRPRSTPMKSAYTPR